LIRGTVSEFEERAAADFNRYNWTEWCALSKYDRTAGVAYMRVRLMIDAHTDAAQRRHQEMMSNRPRRRRFG